MTTVPAHSFSAPARAAVIAAARLMPGVCGVLASSWSSRTTRTPCSRQSVVAPHALDDADRLLRGDAGALRVPLRVTVLPEEDDEDAGDGAALAAVPVLSSKVATASRP